MRDPQAIVDQSELTRPQWTAIAIIAALNAIDGFDILSISFASPEIANEWNIDKATLGVVLSMEIVGMSIGSVFLGGVADRIGRRRTLMGCLTLIATSMLFTVTATSVVTLCFWRILTGLGIGCILPALTAAAAEHSNAANRKFAVTIMAAGYPLGAVIGGTIAAQLLKYYDWRSIFVLGGCISAVFIPTVYWGVPETVGWLMQTRPPQALKRINQTLTRLGLNRVDRLPFPQILDKSVSAFSIFNKYLLFVTAMLTLMYFSHIFTFYYIIKWLPKFVVDDGFNASQAAEVLVWLNIGGAIGSVLVSVLSSRLRITMSAITLCLLSAFSVILLGFWTGSLFGLMVLAATVGFFVSSAVVCFYALIANFFPVALRAQGTGFVIGVGRGLGAAAPVVAGALLQGGLTSSTVSVVMGTGSLVAAASLLLLVKAIREGVVRLSPTGRD